MNVKRRARAQPQAGQREERVVKRERERERDGCDAGDGISHYKVFRPAKERMQEKERAREGGRRRGEMRDDRRDDKENATRAHDERRKGKHSERGKRSRLTGGCFGPVPVRFLSIRRPATAAAAAAAAAAVAAERDLGGRRTGVNVGEWSRRMTRETAGERDPRDANGGHGESCEALRGMARLRGCETGREEEREKEGDAEAAATPVG